MKIKLCHHYWQDTVNAVWRPQSFPYPKIEKELKQLYPILQEKQPVYHTFGNVTVFFNYRPGRDVYGRDIVPISFAFVPECENPEKCGKVIGEALEKADYDTLELDLPNLPGVKKTKKKYLFFTVLGLGLAIVLASAMHFSFSRNPAGEALQRRVTDDRPKLDENEKVLQENSNDEEQLKTMLQHTKKTEEVHPVPEQVVIQLAEGLCDPTLAQHLAFYKCPEAYRRARCSGGLEGITFEQWRKNTSDYGCTSFERNPHTYAKKTLTRDEENLVKKFFK